MLGVDVSVWETIFSPEVGTVVWTSWWEDLVTLEAKTQKLAKDAKYGELVLEGHSFIQGPVNDGLSKSLRDAVVDVAANVVSVVSGVVGGANIGRSFAAGAEVAERADAITGGATTFLSEWTGSFGGVSWITGYESIEAFERGESSFGADPTWVGFLDSIHGCFLEDPSASQVRLFRRLA